MRVAALFVPLAFAVLTSSTAAAQDSHGGDCSTTVPPPADLAAWSSRTPFAAAKDRASLDAARLVIGRAVEATLLPTGDVGFVSPPERPGSADRHSGMFSFDVAEAGSYRVALGGGGWIDVLENGKSVTSSGHGKGLACTGIGKTVTFPLQAGRHVLQIAGSDKPVTGVLIVRVP